MTEISKETVRAALADDTIFADGHSIMEAAHYEQHFDVTHLVEIHISDGTGKGSISDADGALDNTTGVYNLAFLHWLHEQLDIAEPVTARGRGWQAREIVSHITKWAEES